MAARAGVAPWRHTYWELAQRAEVIAEEAWSHTAWLAYITAVSHGDGKQRYKPDDFNPLELAKAQEREQTRAETSRRLRAQMPKTLSEAEIERRWIEFKESRRG